jgi:crotonobetainyl-CoA:carnitine CoA-transferase CaiB-like acyl-CoA transferase
VTQALEGIKVLDTGRTPMTVYCSMLMGDFGADVIWVQDPEGRRGDSEDAVRNAAFDATHRNKRSITLNLKTKEAQEVFHKLARDADVVLEGFRPGVMKRLGADYETLKKINPRIIYCSISGFGQTGPYRDLPGHDSNYSSIAGAMGLVGEKGRKPVPSHNFLADIASGGLISCIGVLAALMAREKTGEGQYVDLSMTDGVAFMMASVYSEYFNRGTVPERESVVSNGGMPYYTAYKTADDKYITIAAIEPKFYENLCRVLDREDLIASGRERENWPALKSWLEETFLTKTRDEWFDIFSKVDMPVGKVYSVNEAVNDPQLLAREMFMELEHPQAGKVRQIGFPLKLSGTPASVRRFAPVQGEHTEEILPDLGYDPDAIARLRQAGAI